MNALEIAQQLMKEEFYACGMRYTMVSGFVIDDPEVDFILKNRSYIIDKELNNSFPAYSTLSEVRKAILITIAFKPNTRSMDAVRRCMACTLEGMFENASKEIIEVLGGPVEKLAYAYEVDRI